VIAARLFGARRGRSDPPRRRLSIISTTFTEGRERNIALGGWGAVGGFGAADGVLPRRRAHMRRCAGRGSSFVQRAGRRAWRPSSPRSPRLRAADTNVKFRSTPSGAC